MNSALAPQLDRPGKGLPFWQILPFRFIIFPKLTKNWTWESAQERFDAEEAKIVALVKKVPLSQLDTKILVKGVRGIEDSSRFWSINLTLEHLGIVNDGMSTSVVELSCGRVPPKKVDIALVKPAGHPGTETELPSYQASAQRYRNRIWKETKDRNSKAKLAHPWFGPLTAYQWHCVGAIHQSIHRRQIEAIIKGLS